MFDIETFLKLPYSAIINIASKLIGNLKLQCWWCHQPNEDGVGNYLVFWIKIINIGKESVYFERIEAIDSKGSLFYPSVFVVEPGQEIMPQKNVVALIPCGHILSTMPKEISIVDATEKNYRLRGKKLSKALASLHEEASRLESLGYLIHPTKKWS